MKRILVIEDDAEQRELLNEVLTEAGYEVLEACDGKAGLDLFRQQPCTLVITDIFMPEKEGLETIRELRSEFLGVKIIAMSGGGLGIRSGGNQKIDVALEAAQAFGANRILNKPFKIKQLLETVGELI